jgi:two-component system, chemotaxis family, protein-glutamate methylesterase/glutaminase
VTRIGPPRVVVADDSSFMRRLLAAALTEGGFDVAGVAEDGEHALGLCAALRPDALSLDLAMPGMNGLDVLRRLKATGSPIPVVVVSAFSPAFGARAVDALAEGAFELVAKPTAGEPVESFLAELCQKVGLAARSRMRAPAAAPAVVRPSIAPIRPGAQRAVVIATSTGGPRALAEVLPHLPAPLGRGTVIVQHMPAGFTASLADRLDRMSALGVREAKLGDAVEPGVALLAPGGSHLRLDAAGKARLSDEAPVGGLRPRADLTIADAANAFGEQLVLVVMTGMGRDGLQGAVEVKRRGGRVLAEAESTCTVYGMPRAVVDAGLADEVVPLADLPAAIAAEAAGGAAAA